MIDGQVQRVEAQIWLLEPQTPPTEAQSGAIERQMSRVGAPICMTEAQIPQVAASICRIEAAIGHLQEEQTVKRTEGRVFLEKDREPASLGFGTGFAAAN